MANLPENTTYPDGIIKLETTMRGKAGDVVYDEAGNLVDGFLNAPLQQLASRTAWLKNKVERNSSSVTNVGYFPSFYEVTENDIGKMLNLDDYYGSYIYIPQTLGQSGDEVHFISTSGATAGTADPREFYLSTKDDFGNVSQQGPVTTSDGYINKLRTLYSIATIKKIGNTWVMFGDLVEGHYKILTDGTWTVTEGFYLSDEYRWQVPSQGTSWNSTNTPTGFGIAIITVTDLNGVSIASEYEYQIAFADGTFATPVLDGYGNATYNYDSSVNGIWTYAWVNRTSTTARTDDIKVEVVHNMQS